MNEVVVSIVIVVATLFAGVWLASVSCHARWEGSGMKTEWNLIGGCKVQRKDGTWVPASAIRDLTQ